MSNNATETPTIRIKWIKSSAGAKPEHRRTIRALGLKRLQQEITKTASPQVLGMTRSVRHLVEVTEVAE